MEFKLKIVNFVLNEENLKNPGFVLPQIKNLRVLSV